MRKILLRCLGIGCVFLLWGCTTNYQDILVAKVIDGDSLRLANGQRVRFIGVDCPELIEGPKLYEESKRTGLSTATLQALGLNAQAFTKRLVEGKRVRLEFDLSMRNRRNDQGELLAYVFLKDTTFVNGKIIGSGYGFYVAEIPNGKYNHRLKQLYQEAQEGLKGIFATERILSQTQ